MRKRTISTLVPAALAALAIGQPLIAQTAGPTPSATEAELAALRARVATLESTSNKGLSFSLANGTSIELYGYVKGDLIYDSNYNLGNTTFGLRSIGLPGGPAAGNFTRGQAKQSRFGFRIDSGEFKARIEGDFFGVANAFRLRHAYGQWNGILVGQTWSNFMPLESAPSTVDFQGPAGIPFSRVQQVRYSYNAGNGFTVAGSLENDVSGNSSQPAVTLAGQYSFDKGSIRVAGISRSVTIAGSSINPWGVTVGAVGKLWQGGTLVANYTTGDGISDELAFALGGNAQVIGGNAVGVDGITVGISQDIGDQFTFGVAYGRTRVDQTLVAIDTRQLETLHVSAWYKPVRNVKFGLEYFTGTRTQANGAEFSADRVQFAGQFSF